MQLSPRPERNHPRTTARRVLRTATGLASAAVALAGLIARYMPIPDHRTLYMVIASPYLMLAAPVAVVVLGWGRRWILAGAATLLMAALIGVQIPSHFGDTPDAASTAVRVMTINMRYGHADSDSLVRSAGQNADIVMVQEITREAVQNLTRSGLDASFPYKELDPRAGAAGVGIYSRHPLINTARIDGFQLALVTATVAVPDVRQPVAVASIHLAAPWPQAIDGWHGDLTRFPRVLGDLKSRAGDGSVIVAGDFNSTIDMRPFRDLLTDGYRDAAEQAGDGRNLTFPANRRYPPLIGIDHVLTRYATAVTTSTIEIPDTDHRALLATVMVPKD